MTKTTERPIAKNKLLDLLAKRLFVYSLLKRIFIDEPSADFIELLTRDDLVPAVPYRDDNAQIKEGIDSISFYLKDPELLQEQSINQLKADYTYLFIGTGKMPSPPYESVYRSKKKLVFQDETIDVRMAFAKHGLEIKNLKREPDDHIGMELDFMAYLCDWTMKATRKNQLTRARKYINAQKSFMNEHLMQWVPRFSEDIARASGTDFYRGAGKLLLGFLTVDKEEIDNLLKQINLRIRKDREVKAKAKKA